MTDNKGSNNYKGIIDLRSFIQAQLDHIWIIAAAVILSSLVAYLFSIFVLSPQYTSSAYVSITEPIIRAELDSSILVTPTIPDADALVKLAESDDILNLVSSNLRSENNVDNIWVEYNAFLEGDSYIRLQVISEDPKISSLASNTWAEIYVQRINYLHKSGDTLLSTLTTEVGHAKERWESSQDLLENYLPDSEVPVLDRKLTELQNILGNYLIEIESNNLIIKDAETLLDQLADSRDDESLSTSKAFALIALQQRASGWVNGAQFEIQQDEFLGSTFTIEDGRKELNSLISALYEQNLGLEDDLNTIEENITLISVSLEQERFELEELTQKRDMAKNTYLALANQFEEVRIMNTQNDSSAQIGAQAVRPTDPEGPDAIMNSILTGVLTLMTSSLVIWVLKWWKQDSRVDRSG